MDRIKGFATGLFEIARAEGKLDTVKDELLAVARAFESNQDLRDALSDPRLPTERKHAIIDDLLGSRANSLTVDIVEFITDRGMAADLPHVVDALIEVAAAATNREVAEIRTAVELDDDTLRRLLAALERITGKVLEPKVIVDPDVMGGIVARVGDRVIDGSVHHKLEEVRQKLSVR